MQDTDHSADCATIIRASPTGAQPVVAIIDLGHKGGGPRVSVDMAGGLNSLGVRTVAIVSRKNQLLDEYLALRIPVLTLRGFTDVPGLLRETLFLPAELRRTLAQVKRLGISHAVFAMHNPWNPPLMLLMRAAGVSYAYVLHDASPHPGEEHRWVHSVLFDVEIRLSRLFVCLSNSVRSRLIEDRGIAEDRVLLVRHGARLPSVPASRRSPSNGSACRLLFLGRILTYKGLDILCEAFRRLRADGVPVELEIAGEGKLPPSAACLAGTPGVTIRNEFIPENEIGGILSRATVLVAPYVEASQSGVIPLAFANGVPVVCSPVGGLVEQVTHGANGLILESASVDALVATLRRLAADPALQVRLSTGALHTAAAELDWARLMRPLVAFLLAGRQHVDG